MSERRKSQKGFVAVTLITLLAIAAVLIVYASLLASFEGGEVTVGTIQASVWYSKSNSTTKSDYEANLYNLTASDSLYSKINITQNGYAGPVSITWKLQKKNGGTWSNETATVTTSVTLTGSSGQQIYASPLGETLAGNHNWMDDIGSNTGSYRVKVWIESTG